MSKRIGIALALLLFIWWFAKKGIFLLTRGFRNNNPGNIKSTATEWQGKIGSDGIFVIFNTIGNGMRALGLNVLYIEKIEPGTTSLREFGLIYAPPIEENNFDREYGVRMARSIGADPDATYDFFTADSLANAMRAIIINENTLQPYSWDTIRDGAVSALTYKGMM